MGPILASTFLAGTAHKSLRRAEVQGLLGKISLDAGTSECPSIKLVCFIHLFLNQCFI